MAQASPKVPVLPESSTDPMTTFLLSVGSNKALRWSFMLWLPLHLGVAIVFMVLTADFDLAITAKWITVSRDADAKTAHYDSPRKLALCEMDPSPITGACNETYNKTGNKCYKRLANVLWDDAREACQRDAGGRLASIMNASENHDVFQACDARPFRECLDDVPWCTKFCFIGLWKSQSGKGWEWESTGVQATYTNWVKLGRWTEPSHDEGVEENVGAVILSEWGQSEEYREDRIGTLRIYAIAVSCLLITIFLASSVSSVRGFRSEKWCLILGGIIGDIVCLILSSAVAIFSLAGLDPEDIFKAEKIALGIASVAVVLPLSVTVMIGLHKCYSVCDIISRLRTWTNSQAPVQGISVPGVVVGVPVPVPVQPADDAVKPSVPGIPQQK